MKTKPFTNTSNLFEKYFFKWINNCRMLANVMILSSVTTEKKEKRSGNRPKFLHYEKVFRNRNGENQSCSG